MPKFQAIHARVKVEDRELPEYDVQVDEYERQVSCWIPSEAGKNFSVCWTTINPLSDTEGRVMLDGVYAGGYVGRSGITKEYNCSNYYTTSTTIRKFSFSPISFTDEDEYLATPTANLGEIKIDVWAVVNVTANPYKLQPDDPVASFNTKVHERSKKVGAHRVKFGDLEPAPSVIFYSSTKVARLATFIFRYRPMDILRANDIAPPAPRAAQAEQSNKRKSVDDDVIEIYSSDEGGHANGSKAGAVMLIEMAGLSTPQDKRRAKKAKVKVEQREHAPVLNDVIDLT